MFDISCDGLSDLKLDDGFHFLHGPTSVLSKTIRIIKKLLIIKIELVYIVDGIIIH